MPGGDGGLGTPAPPGQREITMSVLLILAIFGTLFGTACLVAGTLELVDSLIARRRRNGGPRS